MWSLVFITVLMIYFFIASAVRVISVVVILFPHLL